ncbi:MAG: hypothetical protein CM1200mP2_32250 [Planctomycetaceae bacterium]|nr:MAG: hypothetical protein CM1200mP2_32250 [Planctomycetaceae bacterium]
MCRYSELSGGRQDGLLGVLFSWWRNRRGLNSRLRQGEARCWELPDKRPRPVRGISRRDILKVGGTAAFGLSLPEMLGCRKPCGRGRSLRWCRFRKSQARDHALPAGWAEPPRPVGSQAERSGQRQECLQADRYQVARRAVHREHAEPGEGQRQVHDDPVDELHADRVVQPHCCDLHDADRLHGR